jgi:hypothetical protein
MTLAKPLMSLICLLTAASTLLSPLGLSSEWCSCKGSASAGPVSTTTNASQSIPSSDSHACCASSGQPCTCCGESATTPRSNSESRHSPSQALRADVLARKQCPLEPCVVHECGLPFDVIPPSGMINSFAVSDTLFDLQISLEFPQTDSSPARYFTNLDRPLIIDRITLLSRLRC